MIVKVFFILSCSVVACHGCILLLNGWKPLGIEKRAELAEIVTSSRTLSKSRISGHKVLYAAKFEVLSILKGWDILQRLKQRGSRSVQSNERLILTASGFGDRRFCFSSVDVGETYILFLAYNNVSDSLVAKYDDIFGAAELLYESSEEEILLSLGWRPWSAWTDCSQQCGGGFRLRHRQCIDKSICTGPSEEMRECNMFPCKGTYNVLSYTGSFRQDGGIYARAINDVYDTFGGTRVPSVPTYLVFPDKFPASFSLFITVKARRFDTPKFIFSSYDANSRMQFGVKVEQEQLSFVYTNPLDVFGEKILKTFAISFKQNVWQEIAISVDKKLLKIVVNCKKVGEAAIEWELTNDFDIFGFMYVGADKLEGKASHFKNKVTQLMISNDPGMLWKQCGTRVFFYPGILGKSRQEAPVPSRTPFSQALLTGDDSESGDTEETLIVTSGHGESSGEQSAVSADLCNPVCKNGGTCRNGICECTLERTGSDCSKQKYCNHVCLNGALCFNGQCLCKQGWSGENCGQALCRRPCQNGGICSKPDFCLCKNGTDGKYCEKYVCYPECQNGGRCVGPNTCHCPSQVKGKFCEKDTCFSLRCLNGGKCIFGKCVCSGSFYGKYCEKRVCKMYGTRKASYLRPVVTAEQRQFKYQCGLLMLRTCSTKKLIYRIIQKVAFRDEYFCREWRK